MNTIGKLYTLTSFGESHGEALGGVIDGCPAGVPLSLEKIQCELDRRKPGQSSVTTSRKEEDRVEVLSGIFEGMTTGAPIGFIIRNRDQRSQDYEEVKDLFRPSHADYTVQKKYGIRVTGVGGVFPHGNTWCVSWVVPLLARFWKSWVYLFTGILLR